MKRVTLDAVAKRAGVGEATVDRVLNERGSVAPATAEKVIRAAQELGLRRILPAQWQRQRRIEVFLSASGAGFFRRLSESFLKAALMMGDHRLVIHRTFVAENEPGRLAEKIAAAARTRDGVVVYGQDCAEVREAIEEAQCRGTPVVTIATDLSGAKRLSHVGIDHYQAARTAGLLMGGLCHEPGEVMVVSGYLDFFLHRQRVKGFCDVISQQFPHLHLRPVVEGMDIVPRIKRLVTNEIRSCHNNIVGIYNTGRGNGDIGDVLSKNPRPNGRIFIGHEIYPYTCDMLKKNEMTIVLDQNPGLHVHRSLDILLNCINKGDHPIQTDGSGISFTLHTRENVSLAV